MAGKLLTPISLWKDFDISQPLNESILTEHSFKGVKYEEIYFSGRETKEGRIRIFGSFAKKETNEKMPAILILPDFNKTCDAELISHFANLGYAVLMIDYEGEKENKVHFTKYPKDIEYANFEKAGKRLNFAEDSAKETSWYEWTGVARYAFKYLSSRNDIDSSKIGVMGIKNGGNILWQLIATEKNVCCAISVFGSGWKCYKNTFKYSDNSDIMMDDERYRWIAGVEAHSYSQYATCPVLLLSATNDREFDQDRVFDTLSRVNLDIPSKCNIAVRFDGYIGANSYGDIILFLEKYLLNKELELYKNPDLEIETIDGKLQINCIVDKKEDIKRVDVFYSEGTIDPSLRNWCSLENIAIQNDKYSALVKVYDVSNKFFAFVRTIYNNGLTLTSKMLARNLSDLNLTEFEKSSRLLYSSQNGKDNFTIRCKSSELLGGFIFLNDDLIEIVNGPYGINGIYSSKELLTYKPADKRFKASENSILKLDIFSNNFTKLTIFAYKNYSKQNCKEYVLELTLTGGNFWDNKQIQPKEFKTKEGFSLDSFKEIEVLSFQGKDKYAINNILWI